MWMNDIGTDMRFDWEASFVWRCDGFGGWVWCGTWSVIWHQHYAGKSRCDWNFRRSWTTICWEGWKWKTNGGKFLAWVMLMRSNINLEYKLRISVSIVVAFVILFLFSYILSLHRIRFFRHLFFCMDPTSIFWIFRNSLLCRS